MELNYREHGEPVTGRLPVFIVHGLFGSASNWNAIARRLAQHWHVLVPDLRNHGGSGHDPDVSYDALASDLLELIDRRGFERIMLVGHSMGGKASMWLALNQPQRIERLMVVDIAPVAYGHDFDTEIDAMRALPLDRISDRREADRLMSAQITQAEVRAFLLQNLVREGERWRWRINLDALAAGNRLVLGFPDPAGRSYPGPCRFLHGSASNYVQAPHHALIRQLFPAVEIESMAGAGHWLHAERPADFVAALQGFLSS